MRRFFIYSLPRSGSAWLSQFLSQPGSYCYHEPFADGGWDYLDKRWQNRPEQVLGGIDTSAYQTRLMPPEGLSLYALLRSKREIQSSLRLKGWVLDIDAEILRFNNVIVGMEPIYYNYLSDIRYLHEVWHRITGLPFDAERAAYLIEMNVQRKFAAVRERFLCSTSASPT